METNQQAVARMSGMFRAGSPPSGIKSVLGSVGRKPDGPDDTYGSPRKNIDADFDDFSLQPGGGGAGSGPRTFFSKKSGSNVKVTAGAINGIIVAETTIVSPASGNVIYIHVTVDGDGLATAAVVESAASLPANTATEGYTPIATVGAGGAVAPVAWNYSQVQTCGEGVYLWGGFGS